MSEKKPTKTSDFSHPRQPIGYAADGVIRFKKNAIIDWMLEQGRLGARFDLNMIVSMFNTKIFPVEDLVQLDQLIGYSVSGFGDLSYIPEQEVSECDKIAEAILKEAKK